MLLPPPPNKPLFGRSGADSPNSPSIDQSKVGRVQEEGTKSCQLEPSMSWRKPCTLCREDSAGQWQGRCGCWKEGQWHNLKRSGAGAARASRGRPQHAGAGSHERVGINSESTRSVKAN